MSITLNLKNLVNLRPNPQSIDLLEDRLGSLVSPEEPSVLSNLRAGIIEILDAAGIPFNSYTIQIKLNEFDASGLRGLNKLEASEIINLLGAGLEVEEVAESDVNFTLNDIEPRLAEILARTFTDKVQTIDKLFSKLNLVKPGGIAYSERLAMLARIHTELLGEQVIVNEELLIDKILEYALLLFRSTQTQGVSVNQESVSDGESTKTFRLLVRCFVINIFIEHLQDLSSLVQDEETKLRLNNYHDRLIRIRTQILERNNIRNGKQSEFQFTTSQTLDNLRRNIVAGVVHRQTAEIRAVQLEA